MNQNNNKKFSKIKNNKMVKMKYKINMIDFLRYKKILIKI